jgi:Two component regulator propeller
LRRYIFYTSLLFILCCCLRAAGQQPYYYTINDDNGLPSNEVYQLQQDDFGYMWIGCNSGLFRYDGFNFRPYKNEKQNSIAISGLTMAAGKRLHAQNFSGQLFYIDNDSLVLYADVKDKIRAHPAYSVDKAGNTWIGLPEGLLKQDASGKQTLFFSGQLWAIEVEACDDGTLYLADASKGLLKMDSIPGKISPAPLPHSLPAKPSSRKPGTGFLRSHQTIPNVTILLLK